MAQLSDKLLSWLYSCLHEYYDPQRTYSDAVKVLANYPSSVLPRTDIYNYENGTTALLLAIAGTIPVGFRGTTYRFPIELWIPHNYPHEPPIVFVTPGKDMLVRPGQHVGVDGRLYHPYLRDWSRMWDRASLTEFLGLLQHVFAKEPPVISKAQQQQYQRPLGQGPQSMQPAGPAPPQLPPKQRPGTEPVEMPSVNTPPPRPPKPGEVPAPAPRDVNRDGPPLPPLPPQSTQDQRIPTAHQIHTRDSYFQAHQSRSSSSSYQNGRPSGQPAAPPLPQQQQLAQPQHHRVHQDRSPVSPLSPINGYSELPENKNSYPPTLPPPRFQPHQNMPPTLSQNQPPHQYHAGYAQGHSQAYPPANVAQLQTAPQHVAESKRQPPPDLLTDPFDIALPGLNTSGVPPPAPPIPPNPEKEHLLQAISGTLVQQAHQKVNQNLSAITPLQAQQHALRAAHERLEAEIRQLEQLDLALSSNEAILHRSIQDCDRTIEMAKLKKQPPVDDVLIAPTMVANQLWTLCAEEAACREAMYVLQKAVDRGRISGHDFVRQMRGLGRECFLKMALARKCARGMGLETAQ